MSFINENAYATKELSPPPENIHSHVQIPLITEI